MWYRLAGLFLVVGLLVAALPESVGAATAGTHMASLGITVRAQQGWTLASRSPNLATFKGPDPRDQHHKDLGHIYCLVSRVVFATPHAAYAALRRNQAKNRVRSMNRGDLVVMGQRVPLSVHDSSTGESVVGFFALPPGHKDVGLLQCSFWFPTLKGSMTTFKDATIVLAAWQTFGVAITPD